MKHAFKLIARVAVACSLLVAVGEGYAGKSTSQDVDFSIELTSGCSINASSVPSFGTYMISAADLIDVPAGTVVINCTSGQDYAWGVGAGGNYSAGSRRMSYGMNYMPYKLYFGGSEIGDKTGIKAIDTTYVETTAVAAAVGKGTGIDQTMDLRANVLITGTSPAPVAGVYMDTVPVTIAW